MNDKQPFGEIMLSVLPPVLAADDALKAIGEQIANAFEKLLTDESNIRIYTRIAELPEGLLDILAVDFKVDWYDFGFSLFEKRNIIAQCFYVHKHLGTKAAVETAISTIYPNTKVEEWFEYNGRPFHFRIKIPITEDTIDPQKHEKVIELVKYYKNVRSVLDSVSYTGEKASTEIYMTAQAAEEHTITKALTR